MPRICVKEFLELNWLNVHDRYLQFIVSDVFKFYSNQCPDYFNGVFCPIDNNGVDTRCCNTKLKLSFHKWKLGMQNLSYVEPCLGSNHGINKYFLNKLGETETDICRVRKI